MGHSINREKHFWHYREGGRLHRKGQVRPNAVSLSFCLRAEKNISSLNNVLALKTRDALEEHDGGANPQTKKEPQHQSNVRYSGRVSINQRDVFLTVVFFMYLLPDVMFPCFITV